MEASPPLHERAMEPKNILRQLSIRREDCREGGGAGEFGLLILPTTCRFLVASVVQAIIGVIDDTAERGCRGWRWSR